jgi:hypothetical protein
MRREACQRAAREFLLRAGLMAEGHFEEALSETLVCGRGYVNASVVSASRMTGFETRRG